MKWIERSELISRRAFIYLVGLIGEWLVRASASASLPTPLVSGAAADGNGLALFTNANLGCDPQLQLHRPHQRTLLHVRLRAPTCRNPRQGQSIAIMSRPSTSQENGIFSARRQREVSSIVYMLLSSRADKHYRRHWVPCLAMSPRYLCLLLR